MKKYEQKLGEFQVWESKEEKVLEVIIRKYTIFNEYILHFTTGSVSSKRNISLVSNIYTTKRQ